jgi:flavin reductase (DIM6/NTAB) family NADH-FMN oxidoreductase RutF
MKKPFIDENNNIVYVLTSELNGIHYGMVATWVASASLRTDETRFTLPLSKHNHSAKAIMSSGKFIIHTIPKSDYNLAFKFGGFHSTEVDKFQGENFVVDPSGIRILKNSASYGFAEVIGQIDADDRHILYCKMKSYEVLKDVEILKQSDLFHQLNPEQRDILSSKYLADSKRDTPLK